MIPVAAPDIGELEERYVLEAVRSGWVSSLGEFIGRFEQGTAELCEVEHAVAVSSGTSALHLALQAVGVGPGDEVLVPDLTFAAVAAVVVQLGAEPVLVDVHPDYWCIDPEAAERAITERTRAVVAVHLYGHPADMEGLVALTRPRGIKLIEDCAEAHGARCQDRPVGSIGDAGTFSFYGNKILTTGEGGAVTTNDAELAARVRYLKDHAMDPERRYYHTDVGYNYRLTNIQAALGCAQLERFAELEAARRKVLAVYREGLGDHPRLQLNPAMPWASPAVWMVCAVLEETSPIERDELLAQLRVAGIDTRPFFVPLHELPPYQSARTVGRDSAQPAVSTRLSRVGFNLPSGHGLGPSDLAATTAALSKLVDAR